VVQADAGEAAWAGASGADRSPFVPDGVHLWRDDRNLTRL
jgi:hypothetical protein